MMVCWIFFFQAVTDCVEQAIIHSLWYAETVIGRDGNQRLSLKDKFNLSLK